MASKIKVDQIQTADGTGTIALQNQLSGMTTASLPALGSAQMPTGSVLQVVQNGTFAQTNFTTRNTWTSTNQNLSITPSSTSSKILVMMTVYLSPRGDANSHIRGGVRLKRGSTVIWNTEASPEHASITGYNGETTSMIPVNALDSPSSTSSVTYSLEAWLNDGSQIYVFGSGVGGSITLMEIAG